MPTVHHLGVQVRHEGHCFLYLESVKADRDAEAIRLRMEQVAKRHTSLGRMLGKVEAAAVEMRRREAQGRGRRSLTGAR